MESRIECEDFVGFKSMGGQKPVTSGISMWSDVFTYDSENGEKLAILVMDTQGVFDSQTSKDLCTVLFATSLMMASTQCYNVMNDIHQPDIDHLELFMGYCGLVREQLNDKPFQKLIFLVRDWQYACETSYGDGKEVVNERLRTTDVPTEIQKRNERIRSEVDQIEGFLLPYPGGSVVGQNKGTEIEGVDSVFIENVKQFVPSVCAPENLIVKKIGGQRLRVRDVIPLLDDCVTNLNNAPKVESLFEVCS